MESKPQELEKALEKYSFLDGHYLTALDGTGYFSSKEIHCKNCCEKKHRNGTTTYYHQMLAASIVHPDHREVIPLCPEPILKTRFAPNPVAEAGCSAQDTSIPKTCESPILTMRDTQ